MYRIQYLANEPLMANLKLNLMHVCVWYTLAAVVRFVRIALCNFVLLSYYTLCTIVYKTAESALDFHKYSTTFHILQQIYSVHAQMISKCVHESDLHLRIAAATRVSMYSLQ